MVEHRTKYKYGCGYLETNPQSIWSGGGGWSLKCTASGASGASGWGGGGVTACKESRVR